MSDVAPPAGSDRRPVFRLVYRSRSRLAPGAAESELGDIFTTARKNNRQLDITGALLTNDGDFAQTLEGDETAVRDLYERIRRDTRHEDVVLLETQTVSDRTFGRWAMAKVGEDGGPDIRLLSNADKRSIVAAGPDPHVTAEQASVLEFMRSSIARESTGP
jgi:hypothetical protein